MIAELLVQLKELRAAIRKNSAINVNSASAKQAAIDAGSTYFRQHRQEACEALQDEAALSALDEDWQQLIRRMATTQRSRTSL